MAPSSATLLTPRAEAEAAQRRASDPGASAWVGASAGSGKTKVLTDRVLRLLLRPETKPGRILCLTFTKAAAAEMATRLARRLGEWAVAEDAPLSASLEALTGQRPDAAALTRARALFAEVLDQPGGMRIATIHAFCQSVLRSFPLEAGLPPQFTLIEEADAASLLADARESTLASGRLPAEAIEAIAGLGSPDDFSQTLAAMVKHRERLATAIAQAGGMAGCDAVLRRRLGLPASGSEPEELEEAVAGIPPALDRAAALLLKSSNKNDCARGAQLRAWLALPPEVRPTRWEEWTRCFLTADGKPYADRSLATKGGLKDDFPEVIGILRAEADRIFAFEEKRRAWRLHAATLSLLALAQPVLAAYTARKARAGAVDFDDLIAAAQRLLTDPGSAWVLYKLDGGLDHLLLDEAQDSNPAQWDIAARLAEEFFAGQGRREEPGIRSIFAVGDEKQSIYGFQGADAAGFARWQAHFSRAVPQAGARFEAVPLQVSFRSTAPVLALVDAVFAEGPARRGVVADGAILSHRADRIGEAGMVELWPPLLDPPRENPEAWQVPEQPLAQANAAAQLAESLAARIAHMLRTETLPSQGGRPIRPGDILVLLRRRTGFSDLLVAALKAKGVPVGGVDRMRLVEQIAVQDLLALCDVLLLPEDDLQLAAVLKSPLIGLSEEELFEIAHGREQPLWWRVLAERGKDTTLGRAADWLAELADQADLHTPHTLLAEVLGIHGGRARLLARLGPDAADPLDEVLNAALTYESRHPPSLQGFVQWLRRGGALVKREAESGVDAVRLLTAHGAKGLQAPVVILPDIGNGLNRDTLRWSEADPPLPFWAPRKELHAPAWNELAEAEALAREAEENRLLYVALTRAEDRLLVCTPGEPKPGCWYDLVAQGFSRLPGVEEAPFQPAAFGAPPSASFQGPLRRLSCEQTAPARLATRHAGATLPEPPPDWVQRPAPVESALATFSPSSLQGEDETPAAAPHGAADPAGNRFRRGRMIHALLQHLPEYAPGERRRVAAAFLGRPGQGLSREEQAATLEEVLGLLEHPDLAEAFAPGSLAEAPIAGIVSGVRLVGQVDRLSVRPDRVIVLDYKTNRPPPEALEGVQPVYLRQMAAYRALLRQIWPDRPVECWLVWTWTARAMPLPDGLLDRHTPSS
ncbi:double-strand break repair helicase AddA [Roseomonas marmotae]|uniref:DNA 3'-5' helicase n=1 Tax=Roseomonas marmotae TaxID=2768161 RepID=A0ABS3KGP5_9PROT|nr:double-strand break repair helicase AddA [Roseomonas marmotae]MBO1076624.1 double-strand break repair helicase AddA [Roseomonas marmotae]QTI79634.1 double-strand break repair helicase AddA [Roseomonas marmotae]